MESSQIPQLAPLPHGICAPLVIEQGFPWLLLLGALIVAVILLGTLCSLLLKKRGQKAPPSLQTEMLRRLHAIRPQQTAANALVWTDKATHILRSYLEQRFSLPATYQTTEEFFASSALKEVAEMQNRELQQSLHEALQLADLIKFAKMQPDTAQLERIEKAVESCIRKTPFPASASEKRQDNKGES